MKDVILFALALLIVPCALIGAPIVCLGVLIICGPWWLMEKIK